MENRQSQEQGSITAREARLASQMTAARRELQDHRSEAERALDTAVERLAADLEARERNRTSAQPGAAEETAPLVHVVVRRVLHEASHDTR